MVKCKLNGIELKVSENKIEINDSILQIELVKRFIDCRAITKPGESPLPLFFNKYLRHYPITDIHFIEEKEISVIETEWIDNYIDDQLDGFENIAA